MFNYNEIHACLQYTNWIFQHSLSMGNSTWKPYSSLTLNAGLNTINNLWIFSVKLLGKLSCGWGKKNLKFGSSSENMMLVNKYLLGLQKNGEKTITTKQNATWSESPSWKFNANDIEAKLSFMQCCSKEAGKMTIYRAFSLSCLPQDTAVKWRKGFSALLLLQNIYMFTTWVSFFRVEFSCC